MSDFEPRFYDKEKIPTLPDGQKLGSVTTITGMAMKYGLLYFYGKHGTVRAKEIAKEAAGIGTGTHDYIIDCSKGNKIGVPDTKYRKPISNYEKFRSRFKPTPVLVDFVVFSLEHGYAGTLDEVDLIEKKLVLLDWKTSKDLYDDYKLQVEAYYRALLEMIQMGLVKIDGVVIEELWLVQLDKEKDFDEKKHVLKFKPDEGRFKAFLGLKEYFHWNTALKSV